MTVSREDVESYLTAISTWKSLCVKYPATVPMNVELNVTTSLDALNGIEQVLEDRLNQVDNKMLQMSEIPKTGDIIAYNMNDEPFIVCYVEDDYFTDGKTEYHKSCFKGWLPLPKINQAISKYEVMRGEK